MSGTLKKDISRVLVTGTSGCVGGFLVRHLLRAGYEVVAADRQGVEAFLPSAKASLLVKQGDLASPAFAASCLEGVDAVFHAGSHADGLPLYGEPDPAPIQATETLYRQARRAGVKRFILFTSSAVYTARRGPVCEDTALEARGEYEHAQLEMERAVLGHGLPGLPSVTIIRPAPVYGPRCKALTAFLATTPALAKSLGPYYIPLASGPRRNLVHGDDVARAGVFLLLHPGAYGGIFNVADNDPMPFGQFINAAMDAYGLKPLKPGVSYPAGTLLESILPCVDEEEIFNPLGMLGNVLWQRIIRSHGLSKALIPKVKQAAVPLGRNHLVVDNRKLRGLGFRLRYPRFRRGWQNTLSWYVSMRWVPRPDEL